MLTPITCLVLVCDNCGTHGEDDDGDLCHFTTACEAREWFALDPHATPDDDLARWHFGTDGSHLCPDCQCSAHDHVTTRRDDAEPSGPDLAAICLRCSQWLDLRPTTVVIDEVQELFTTLTATDRDGGQVA